MGVVIYPWAESDSPLPAPSPSPIGAWRGRAEEASPESESNPKMALAAQSYPHAHACPNHVFFHSNGEELLNHFPRSVVPAKYGGDLTDCFQEDLMKQMTKDYGSCPLGGQNNYY
ncbi:alpha-tocopherol transfer protein [Trichonephila clavipes]|nr:alpha-tocopherol transfer protein [Trichonephila clavipes]